MTDLIQTLTKRFPLFSSKGAMSDRGTGMTRASGTLARAFASLARPQRRGRTASGVRTARAYYRRSTCASGPDPVTGRHGKRRLGQLVLSAIAACLLLSAAAGPAAAATTAAPGWTLDSFAAPTNFSPSDNTQCVNGITQQSSPDLCDSYRVAATNAGSLPMTENGSADGSTATITDNLPAGLTVQQISFFWTGAGAQASGLENQDLAPFGLCTSTPAPSSTPVQCQLPTNDFGVAPIAPDDRLEMSVYVTVDDPNESAALTNSAIVSGGGAPDARASSQNAVGLAPPAFGPASFSSYIAGPDGRPDTQAGDHPYEFTTRIDLNTQFRVGPTSAFLDTGPSDLRDAVVDLPLGFLGTALATPQCTFAKLSESPHGGCPPDTQVGEIIAHPTEQTRIHGAIYNMVPEHGVAAEFGYIDQTLLTAHVLYAKVVPSPAGYVLETSSPQIAQAAITDLLVTFFGNPTARDGSGNTPAAMFTNPSSCSGQPLTTAVHLDSWQHPGRLNADGTPDLSDPNWVSATSSSPPVTGCNQLQFKPAMTVEPDTTVADSPSGLEVDIKVPQSEDPLTLATPPLKDASVALPPGFTVNPSSAAGLGACSPAQIALGSATSPTCPDNSKIGTVELTTPLLPGTLQGSIYLASEFDNPFHSLIAGYIVVDDPTTGVVIKIPGNLTPDPITGQITGVFDNNPQFPFSDLKLHFKGGTRGVLASPESCGTFTTDALFSPWSFPDSGPASTPSDSFSINSGCVSGFAPSFTAGTQNAQAGRFSPFVLSLSRSDTDQNFSGLAVKLPPGMLAKLAGVAQCSEQQLALISSQPGTGAAQAANPSCPVGSQVGTVQTGSGAGPDPFFLGGKAYLTGPYKGAPYGLAGVVPALAGPFDLGTVVVRQALYVDPTTAQVTAVSDPFPTILDGIPLRIRRVDVTLDRPNFTLNPTSCDPMSVGGIFSSTGGLVSGVSSRFQVGGCQALAFSPKLAFKLTGKGQTHSGNHPTLTANLTQPFGQANIRSAKVALPLSLALDPNNSQHVCNYDVAQAVHGGAVACPASTIVGSATAVTPLLDHPLTGKVYLVQGIRFGKTGNRIRTLPSLLIPLRGQISLDLRASSSVNGAQQLVTTFSTIPDAPVSKFTLQINGGRKGILVITGRGRTICGSPQVANANFGAQSGKTNTQNDTMSTPCGKAAHLRVLSHGVKGRALIMRVRTSERGRLTVSGPELRGYSHVLSGGVHEIRVGLKSGAHAASVMVNVTLTPSNARPATHTFRMRT